MPIIGIDHGNKQIKTVHCKPFVSGLQQSTTKPFGKDVLYYNGAYYTLMDQRIPYRKDKTDDNRFFVLTLFALAGEIVAREYSAAKVVRVKLAVGLPPAHFGTQAKRFTEYFQGHGIIKFTFNEKSYEIYIEDVNCFPQAYAAAATMLYKLKDDTKVVILDIGGFTADYLLLVNGKADLSTCDSLENGVILLYNRIRSKANAELDILLDENDVDIILGGKGSGYPESAIRLVEQQAQQFVSDLFSTLRERMLNLRFIKVIFVGGGSILLRRQIEASGKVSTSLFVDDIKANAKGYEYLYRVEMTGR